MITYQEEKIIDILEELDPLLTDHYEEIAWRKDKIKLSPDYDKYLKLEEMGILHTVTAREPDAGKLVGYFISFVQPHLHYSDTLYAVNDILYMSPEYRATEASANLFRFAEESLKSIGVDVITLHMKVWLPFEALSSYLGYEKIEYNYSKYIGE